MIIWSIVILYYANYELRVERLGQWIRNERLGQRILEKIRERL